MATEQPAQRHALRRHGSVLAIYAVLSILLTWPLATRLTSYVAGDGIDDPALAWNLWWLQERLVGQQNLDIFNVDWLFFPIRINLAFYTLTPLNGLLSVPLQSGLSLVLAANLLLLFSYVMGAYGAFLLARYLLCRRRDWLGQAQRYGGRWLTTDDWIALVAGIIYAFASSKLFYASLGQFNIASSQWIPFCVLYVVRIYPARTAAQGYRAAAMAGLFLVFQAWAELTYATFLLIFIGIYFAYVCLQWFLDRRGTDPLPDSSAQNRRGPSFWAVLAQFFLIGVVAAAGILPFLWAMAPDLLREGDFFTSGGGFADLFSADLLGYLVPTRLHPLLGNWTAQLPFPNDKGQHLFIGYVAMALAAVGVVCLVRSSSRRLRREGWFWLAAVVLFWWLTTGPELRWAGQSLGIPGPFALVSRLPFFSGNRYPSRYSVMLMLCVAVLVAYGLAWIVDRLQRPRGTTQPTTRPATPAIVAIVVAGLFLFEHLSAPLPLNDFRIPPIYAQLADLPDETTLLELPTGWRNGARVLGRSDVLIMMQQWYQTEHGKRRLGGNTSRNPSYKFQYFSEAPLIGDLIALMNADREHIGTAVADEWDALVARNRPIAGPVLDFLDVDYLTVHVDHTPVELLRFVDEVLPVTLVDEWQGPDWLGRPSTIRLYAVAGAEADGHGEARWEIDLAGELGRLHLAEGWSAMPVDGRRYALRPAADLLVDLPAEGGMLSLQTHASPATTVLRLNGVGLDVIGNGAAESGWITAAVPPGVADQAVDRLTLRFDGESMPMADILSPPGPGGWPIGETGASLDGRSAILVRSAGEETGDFAQIFIDGVDVARNARGYNLAALATDGEVLESVVFDTFASAAEADAMAAWIETWPAGTIIAGAVRDEASMQLTAAAVDALRRLGLTTDLRGDFRRSHAFVGVVDAPPGAGLESSSVLRPATVAVGVAIDGPAVYGDVGTIRFEPASTEQ